MKLRNALLLFFIFSAGWMAAQTDTFDLSSYKARFERRPAMSLNGHGSFNGDYEKGQAAGNTGQLTASFSWQEIRSTDALSATWWLYGNLKGGFGKSSTVSPRKRYHTGELALVSQWNRNHYYRENHFWGWGSTVQANGRLSSFSSGDQYLLLNLAPSIFVGRGRIESAEDALLASWMMDDLHEAGIINNFSPEDITALARTITDIIGNRTFDLRRRRIYELERLQATIRERGLAQEESFALFAILNDNWAFANRTSLPHGKRLAYGLEASSSSRWYNSNLSRTNSVNHGGAFAEYRFAKIINNHNGGRWRARVEGGYYWEGNHRTGEDWQVNMEGLFATVELSYTHRWFPSSRTALVGGSEAGVTWGIPDESQFLTAFSNKQFNWRTYLELDYFINYQWSFSLDAGANFYYISKPKLIKLLPRLNFSTNYFFF